MKIVHINWTLYFGGIETMLVNIANEQVKAGADVSIIIVNNMVEDNIASCIDKRVKLYNLGRKEHSVNPIFLLKLNRLLKKISPDAIHLHSSFFYRMIFSHKLSREASVTLHDLPTGAVRRSKICRILPFFDYFSPGNLTFIDEIPRVFSISQAVHDDLLAHYKVDSKVICNGIATSMFTQREANPYSGLLRIVQVSRLDHEKKGQDLLISAAAKLKGKISIDFIGDGESMDCLKQLAKENQISEYIHFLGKQPQSYVASHLKDYDLFAQPSRYEGFGLTVAEAMAANVPVLVSAGQGPAEITCDETYGWTFENGDVNSLTDKIEYILSHYEEAITKAHLGLEHVVNNYDVSITARKYMDNY